jgi:hypothetical protein
MISKDQILRCAIYSTLGISVLLYLVQVFTPLRLTSDGINYLSLADSAATKGVIVAFRQPNFPFPKGYPLFVYLLMAAGIFSSATLVITNLLLFGLGLAFSFRTLITLGFQRSHASIACLLTFLSFVAVKFITQGMSDFLFFALSAAACWSMTLRSRYKWLAILPCVALAIEVRLIGLALIFPLAATAWPFVRKHPAVLAASSIVTLALVSAGALAGRPYLLKNFQMLRNNGLGRFLGKNIVAHCQDFGELATNVPFSKLPAWSYAFTLIVGGLALVVFFAGIVALRGRPGWSSLYMIGYAGVVLPWPYTDPRFWLPAMPFVLLTMHAGWTMLCRKAPKRIVSAYCIVFCALGFVSLGYSTWLTFSGAKFPYRYGDGLLRATYLAQCSPATVGVDQQALHLLRRYEWRCQGEH